MSAPSLEIAIAPLAISDRAWQVLAWRVGFAERLTLEDAGEQLGGLTRQRVYQIQNTTTQRITARLSTLEPALDLLEAHAGQLWQPSSPPPRADAVARVSALLTTAGWETPHAETVDRLLTAVRALMVSRNAIPRDRWPTLFAAAAALSPRVDRRPDDEDDWDLRRRQGKPRSEWTYQRLAEHFLLEEGAPLHWEEITRRTKVLGLRPDLNPAVFFNTIAGAERFVRVGLGTYGLREWGIPEISSYPEIAAGILKDAKRPLPYGELLDRTNAVRPVQEPTFSALLNLHPRFYRAVDGTYGLRAWLESQSTKRRRVPPEDPASAKRVDQAAQRGYDVARTIQPDLDD